MVSEWRIVKLMKMTADSHFRGSAKDLNRGRKRENAKVSGTCEKLTDEEYEREKVEITIHLELLMELLQENVKNRTHGWTMRKRMKWQKLHAKRKRLINIQLAEELRKLEPLLSCGELRESELKMDVSICGPEQGESLGKEIKEEDFMNYLDSSETSEDVLARKADEAMQSCNFSHSLCMFAECAKDGEQSDGTVTKENERFEVKSRRKFLSEKEGNDLSQQEKSGNAEEKIQGKQMYLFNEIADESFRCNDAETKITQEDYQSKGSDEVLKRFQREIEFLERWLKEPDGGGKPVESDPGEITVNVHDRNEIFLTFMELNECYKFSNNDVTVGTENDIDRYDVEIRGIEQKLFGSEMEDQNPQGSWVCRDIKETLNQQDEGESGQQFETRSIEIQKVNDGRLMPEASKETERSSLFKTNNLLVNAGIVTGAEKHLTQLSSQMKGKEILCSRRLAWDPGGHRTEMHDQEIMVNLNFGSLMQEHLH